MVTQSPKSRQTNTKRFDQALKTQSQLLWLQGELSTFFYHLPDKSQALAPRDTLWDPQGTEKHREIHGMFPKANFLSSSGSMWVTEAHQCGQWGRAVFFYASVLGWPLSMFSRRVSLQGSHDSPGTAVVCPSVRYPACYIRVPHHMLRR